MKKKVVQASGTWGSFVYARLECGHHVYLMSKEPPAIGEEICCYDCTQELEKQKARQPYIHPNW